jgi:type II secretory pathway component HofQ
MIVATTNNITNKVPILGDIPIIGQAFRSSNRQKDKKEVVILITPRLVEQTL